MSITEFPVYELPIVSTRPLWEFLRIIRIESFWCGVRFASDFSWNNSLNSI